MTRAGQVDIIAAVGPSENGGNGVFPDDMELAPFSRRPIVLPEATMRTVMEAPIPSAEITDTRATPRASIVIVTHDNVLFTRMCLATVLAHTAGVSHEIIIVDNGSKDGTADYLREVARLNPHVRVEFNAENRGFAAANNQGLAPARGDVLVLLNNDVMVPPGWLGGLVEHALDPGVGCVGPVTNRIGNEAEVRADYRTYGQMLHFARRYAADHRGLRFDIATPCMFCLAMRREVYQQVGPIDERFEVGMLEDDDYAMRVRAAGLALVCAEDVFVHHFGQASFGCLFASGKYGELIEANRRRFEEKWGVAWKPYGRRRDEGYDQMCAGFGALLEESIPRGAVVAVINKGDEGLLRFEGRTGWHFPRAEDGTYAGHHPSDGAEAVAMLRRAAAQGAGFLAIPWTALWWLEHYPELREFLERRCELVARREGVGAVYAIARPGVAALAIGSREYRAFVGPPEKFDQVGAMQFNLLVALGLREDHYLLDVGCGSLRAGRLFIPYLLAGHYYGIEPEGWLIEEGIERELGRDILRVKRPVFGHDRDFTLSGFGRRFDFVLAQSVFSHAPISQITRCLSEASKVLGPEGLFAATYYQGAADHAGQEWVYPDCVWYTAQRMMALAEREGLCCTPIDWPHPNGQSWLVFGRASMPAERLRALGGGR